MLVAKNKKALFNNEVTEKYLAGIVLKGYEVKAVREKNVSFEGSHVTLIDEEAFVVGMHIGKFSKQSQEYSEQDAKRNRKLLLSKRELSKLRKEIAEKGKSAIPLAILLKNGRIKLEFAVVKGRKKHEKKGLLKKRQLEIDLQKSSKQKGILY